MQPVQSGYVSPLEEKKEESICDWLAHKLSSLTISPQNFLLPADFPKLTVEALRIARKKFPDIDILDLRFSSVNDPLMKEIINWRYLGSLNVASFSGGAFRYVHLMPYLVRLEVGTVEKEERGQFFASLPALEHLSIHGKGQHFSEEDLQNLTKHCKNLLELNLLAVTFDEALFSKLCVLSQLKCLWVQFRDCKTEVRSAALSVLPFFSQLETLQIQCPKEWAKDWKQEISPFLLKLKQMKFFDCEENPDCVQICCTNGED